MKNANGRLAKLPKWAQVELLKKEELVKELESKLKKAELANEITQKMDWFTLGFHTKELTGLFVLDKDSIHRVATIGEGTILLVGRPR
jgi:hypothetical protein